MKSLTELFIGEPHSPSDHPLGHSNLPVANKSANLIGLWTIKWLNQLANLLNDILDAFRLPIRTFKFQNPQTERHESTRVAISTSVCSLGRRLSASTSHWSLARLIWRWIGVVERVEQVVLAVSQTAHKTSFCKRRSPLRFPYFNLSKAFPSKSFLFIDITGA